MKREITISLTNHDRQGSIGSNSSYSKGGVSYSIDSFVVNGSLVYQTEFCGKSPAHWVEAKL